MNRFRSIFSAISTLSAAIAITLAMDSAMPSMRAVTVAGCCASAL